MKECSSAIPQESVDSSMQSVIAIIELPIAIITTVKLISYGKEHKKTLELLPLILLEINTIFYWTCIGYLQLIYQPTSSRHC